MKNITSISLSNGLTATFTNLIIEGKETHCSMKINFEVDLLNSTMDELKLYRNFGDLIFKFLENLPDNIKVKVKNDVNELEKK